MFCLDTSPWWRDPIIAYLKHRGLPNDRAEMQKLQHLSTWYMLLGDILYKKPYSKFHYEPSFRCLGPDEDKKAMQEIHDGEWGNHTGC